MMPKAEPLLSPPCCLGCIMTFGGPGRSGPHGPFPPQKIVKILFHNCCRMKVNSIQAGCVVINPFSYIRFFLLILRKIKTNICGPLKKRRHGPCGCGYIDPAHRTPLLRSHPFSEAESLLDLHLHENLLAGGQREMGTCSAELSRKEGWGHPGVRVQPSPVLRGQKDPRLSFLPPLFLPQGPCRLLSPGLNCLI